MTDIAGVQVEEVWNWADGLEELHTRIAPRIGLGGTDTSR
jgi:hypothetical protein